MIINSGKQIVFVPSNKSHFLFIFNLIIPINGFEPLLLIKEADFKSNVSTKFHQTGTVISKKGFEPLIFPL